MFSFYTGWLGMFTLRWLRSPLFLFITLVKTLNFGVIRLIK